MRRVLPVLLSIITGASLAGCDGAEKPGEEEVAPRAIAMSDVTLIWPLPADASEVEDGSWLFASSAVGTGKLLPRNVYDVVPALTRVDEPDALYSALLVVAARLDPCFQEGAGSVPCQPNLRLVLQPVVLGTTGWEARDAAVHVFYAAKTEAEIVAVVNRLAEERVAGAATAAGPLGVHPLLQNTASRKRVRDLLLPLLGEDRLVRVTSVDVHGDNAAWNFSGFDWVDNAPRPIVIPASGGATVQHFLSASTARLEASMDPSSTAPDEFSVLLDPTRLSTSSVEARQRAFDSAARIENPTVHNPGTIDCVSCHVTAVGRIAASRTGGLTTSAEAFSSNRHDLTSVTDFSNAQLVRALGYRFKQLVLSPRVIHESAAVADRVDAALKSE